VIRVLAWTIILGNQGLVNTLAQALGLTDAPIRMLYTETAIMTGLVYTMVPFAVLTIGSVLENLDGTLEESARDLGATPFEAFLRVTLPLSVPGVSAGAILVFALCLSAYVTPALLGGGRIKVMASLIFEQFMRTSNWPLGSAIACLLLIVTGVVIYAYGRALERRATAGTGMSALARTRRIRLAPRANTSGIGRNGQIAVGTISIVILFALLAPMVVLLVMSFSSADFVIFPPPGFSLKWYEKFFQMSDFLSAFVTSFEVAIAASIGATALGVPAAYALARYRFPGRGVLRAIFLSPLMFPQIIVGVGLLQLYTWLGAANTVGGLIMAHIVAVLPYVIRTVGAALSTVHRNVEEAAADLGANQLAVLALVVVPMIKGGVLAGALFALIMSWINVEISIFISTTGTYTLPVLLYNYMEYSLTPIVVVAAAVSILVAVVLVAIIDRFIGLSSAMRL
jgi:putative spermidine/putrescine transport system permease protein